ncbi:CapA family protein [Methyloceanibacter sp. wino2]|uniref:CapA family protein n=1 Tax=Methyloceanibacter sp. wino2 TaxID=2170729 RepID=UPI000D3EB476|nr:CapA family protein [Methyloceanibacter sp. wino2]
MRLVACTTAFLLAGIGAGGQARAEMRIGPCASTEYTAAIGATPKLASAPKLAGPTQLTLVLAGDTGFNPKAAPVDPKGFTKDRRSLTFDQSLGGIADEMNGDVAFLNLETVLTDRNDLPPDMKGQTSPYNFRSHPAGLDALLGAGFNLFSLANNHSMDYGPKGAEETLYHFALANAARGEGKTIAYAGLGADFEEATRPGCLDIEGMKLGFAATGIVTGQRTEHRAGDNKPGQAAYRRRGDFEIVVNRLREVPADYRILSVHYGLEGRVVPDKRQLDDWRDFAAREKGIDLIVGHHPHVAQGVERVGDSLIFYGLGNFLHPGTAEMKRFGVCRDYGLMAKVHLAQADGSWTVGAIEVIPVTDTHIRPARFAPQEGTRRIYALNYLGQRLGDNAAAEGITFTPRADGTGLYCAAGAGELGGKIGALCASWTPAPPIPAQLAATLASACADKPFYGAGRKKKRRTNSIFGFGQF